jgi:flagellar hook-length control protein FliK
MTQLFPNIVSLADFLVSQNEKPKINGGSIPSPAGFEDFLASQLVPEFPKPKDRLEVCNQGVNFDFQNPGGYKFISSQPFVDGLSLVEKIGLKGSSGVSANTSDSGRVPFLSISYAKALIDPAYYMDKSSGVNEYLPPLESIGMIQMNAGQIKELAARRSIPITLDFGQMGQLDQISFGDNDIPGNQLPVVGNQDKASLALLNSMSMPQPREDEKPIAELSKVQDIRDSQGLTDLTAFIANGMISGSIHKPVALPDGRSAKITVDASSFFREDNSRIPITMTTNDSSPNMAIIKVSELRGLIEQYPDDIFIQIKADIKKIPSQPIIRSDVGSNLKQFEEQNFEQSYLVNLKSLLSSNDSDNLGILQRISLIGISPKEGKTNSKENDFAPDSNSPQAENRSESTSASPKALPNNNNVIYLQKPELSTKQSSVESDKPVIRHPSGNTDEISSNEIKSIDNMNKAIPSAQMTKQNGEIMANIFDKTSMIMKSSDSLTSSNTTSSGSLTANNQQQLIDSAKLLSQIKAQLITTPGTTEMTIKLKPENLGQVRVNLKLNNDKLEAIFRVDNSDVKRILDAELSKLKVEWKLDSIRVETNFRDMENNSSSLAERHQQAKESNGQSSHRLNRDEQIDTPDSAKSKNSDNNYLGKNHRRIDLLA